MYGTGDTSFFQFEAKCAAERCVVRMIRYRPEIDGLRALAVGLVVLFHTGSPHWTGAFVGVDIFFVISGYLITAICSEQIDGGAFRLTKFYVRRIRRILPMQFVVILCCLPAAWLTMMPDPLQNFGQSVVASVFSANNILLYFTSGYWDLASEFKPLLHTWSLGVEEQFYLIYPLLIIFAFKLRRPMCVIALVGLMSLFIAEWTVWRDPAAGFYLLHTRAFELLAGALCALWLRDGVVKRLPLADFPEGYEVVAVLGALLIVISVLVFDEKTPFPSVYTLVPVFGAVFVIIGARDGTACAAVLGCRPLVGIGLISYSLYLWHQPLFAFARIMSFEPLNSSCYIVLVSLAAGLSIISYYVIERPARLSLSFMRLSLILLVSGSALTITGLFLHFSYGMPGRVFPEMERSLINGQYIEYNRRVYEYELSSESKGGSESVIVIGNSVARDFSNVILESGALGSRTLFYHRGMGACLSRKDLPGYLLERMMSAALVVFASDHHNRPDCAAQDIALVTEIGADNVLLVGPKQFGYNLNAFIGVPVSLRSSAFAKPLSLVRLINDDLKLRVPPQNYVDQLELLADDQGEGVRVFDDRGFLLSADRVHLTRSGAQYLGEKLSSRLRYLIGE